MSDANYNQNDNSPPLMLPPHGQGSHVHCDNCGLMVGIVTSGGGLMLMTGHVVRFPTTLKCPPPCGKNLKLGAHFQEHHRFAPKESYPNPRPGLSQVLDTQEDGG